MEEYGRLGMVGMVWMSGRAKSSMTDLIWRA